MLVPVSRDVIGDYWDIIAPGVEESLLPITKTTYRVLNGVLKALISGNLVCWLKIEEDKTLYFLLVGVNVDKFISMGVVTIYSFYSFKQLNVRQAREAVEDIKDMAIKLGCVRVVAYSRNEKLSLILKRYGWETDTKVLTLEV